MMTTMMIIDEEEGGDDDDDDNDGNKSNTGLIMRLSQGSRRAVGQPHQLGEAGPVRTHGEINWGHTEPD